VRQRNVALVRSTRLTRDSNDEQRHIPVSRAACLEGNGLGSAALDYVSRNTG